MKHREHTIPVHTIIHSSRCQYLRGCLIGYSYGSLWGHIGWPLAGHLLQTKQPDALIILHTGNYSAAGTGHKPSSALLVLDPPSALLPPRPLLSPRLLAEILRAREGHPPLATPRCDLLSIANFMLAVADPCFISSAVYSDR